jgi:hypothetical protein
MTLTEARTRYDAWYERHVAIRRQLAADLATILPTLDPQVVGMAIPRDILEICWRCVRDVAGRPVDPIAWEPCPVSGRLLPPLPWQQPARRGRSSAGWWRV